MLEEKPENLLYQKIEDLFDKKTEELKELLYNFTVLHERMSEDKLEFTKQAIKIDQLTKDFTVRVGEFSEVKEETKKDIANSVHAATEKASKNISDNVREIIKQDISQAVKNLDTAAKKGIEAIENYEGYAAQTLSTTKIAVWFISIAVGALAGLLITFFLMPEPKLPLTDGQLTTYENGKHFNDFWFKLSPEEQERLNDIALGKPMPKEGAQQVQASKAIAPKKKKHPKVMQEENSEPDTIDMTNDSGSED
jgi:hypothetical protein